MPAGQRRSHPTLFHWDVTGTSFVFVTVMRYATRSPALRVGPGLADGARVFAIDTSLAAFDDEEEDDEDLEDDEDDLNVHAVDAAHS